jgi:hypothetical protein
MIDLNKRLRCLKQEKGESSKVLKCVGTVEKTSMKKKILIGVAGLTIQNLEGKYGGAV